MTATRATGGDGSRARQESAAVRRSRGRAHRPREPVPGSPSAGGPARRRPAPALGLPGRLGRRHALAAPDAAPGGRHRGRRVRASSLGLVVLLGAGTRRILRRLRIGFVDRGVAAAEALLVLVRRDRPAGALARLLPVLDARLPRRLVVAPGERLHRARPTPVLLRVLLLRGVDGVHLAAGRHPRPLARRPHGDDGRDRHRRGAALGLPRVVRRPPRPGCRPAEAAPPSA